MPRIRTLKPEHKQHRKVGMLTHRQYRLWVGMVTEADDEGRLCAEAAQLRALIFAYHPSITVRHVADDLGALGASGLIRLYRVNETVYACFPSWADHQKVDHPTASALPAPPDTPESEAEYPIREPSRALASVSGGSEGIGRDRKGRDQVGVVELPLAPLACPATADGVCGAAPEPDPETRNHLPVPPKLLEKIPALGDWPDPRALVALWNYHAEPLSLPCAEVLSAGRRKRAMALLRQFPDWRFWNGALAKVKYSRFLTGGVPPGNGHNEPFRAHFDWILATHDGVENIVALHDGKYER